MATLSTYFSSTLVAPYSIISSILNWRICGVLSNYFFGTREARKSLVNSSTWDAFNAQNTCLRPVGPVSDKGVASSSACFFLPIYIVLLYFPSFHFGWTLRERQRETVAFDFVDSTSITLPTVSLQAFLQRVTLTVSFYSFTFFTSC